MKKIPLILSLILMLMCGCQAGFQKGVRPMEFKPPEFGRVTFGSLEKSACSPQIGDESLQTLQIRMPEEVVLAEGETLTLPICGYYNLETLAVLEKKPEIFYKNIKEDGAFQKAIVLAEAEDHEVPPPQASDRSADPELYKNQISTTYLHLDAQRYISVPLSSGEHDFYLSLGTNRSNTVRVRIVWE